jgi:hypothetical protein
MIRYIALAPEELTEWQEDPEGYARWVGAPLIGSPEGFAKQAGVVYRSDGYSNIP